MQSEIDYRLGIGEVFGRRLRELRRERGLRQADLSERLERLGHRLGQKALSNLETATRSASLEDVQACALALGVSPLELLSTASGSPREEDEGGAHKPMEVRITREVSATLPELRAWWRGDWPLRPELLADLQGEDFGDVLRGYFAAVPDEVHDRLLRERDELRTADPAAGVPAPAAFLGDDHRISVEPPERRAA